MLLNDWMDLFEVSTSFVPPRLARRPDLAHLPPAEDHLSDLGRWETVPVAFWVAGYETSDTAPPL